ncbi:MAG: DUF4159 domain-containing protein [Gemmatimonadaceae bacterium]
MTAPIGTRGVASRARAFVTALLACIVLTAQGFGQRPQGTTEVHNVRYDGRFTFARLQYTTAPGGFYYGGLPSWAHGYPQAEQNLSKILNAVSTLAPHLESTNVLAIDDPELFKYPVAFMTEAGFWTMTDKEAEVLRAYLQKGGFIIFDDFRDSFRGGGGWDNFAAQMKRLLPDGHFVDLDAREPIFHSFFELNSLDIVPQFYDRGPPIFRGLYEDNDPSKRLMVMVNFNTDVSNFWEFSATGQVPVSESNEAYKLGVNYVIYGITH